ncbi:MULTISPECIES: antibiotic biosynthesis monooxygenase family protein [Larsenimonas]|uniref:Antibiotic biosynthesis monooxygenase n=1 Tax=Larsenimonas suaedae TaxID=1851019 RepID=A0ABU1GXD0_9GAMM|nr:MULTISPECIES: antibiotic biosynthesis monooxygenase family protein [Larsenimonas]MCM2971451.1 antibiotic biosynthesis monooxygenase [Larsenimonas suaedae]MCM5703559.1 antibiotic biosynthesis monooxygenase [Larsenimonas salina]MDR5896707.1 antibiotic biosynthesis monooxygenase [Larsenimonas suaedae]
MAYIVNNRVFVKPDYAEEFERRFQHRVGQIEQQPGFVRMRILKPQGNQAPYVVETEWESQTAFRDWVGSEDFKAAHANPMPKEAFNDGGGLEQFEVVIQAGG